jgi:hypothetical protein
MSIDLGGFNVLLGLQLWRLQQDHKLAMDFSPADSWSCT